MHNKKVVIIDANEKYLKELEIILVTGGYVPILVSDPYLAVDMVIQNRPDVVLIELRLPHKNGFELIDRLNRIFGTKKVPIIAMSEIFKYEFLWLLDFYGIKKWIKKPFQPLDVIWAIENEITEYSCAQELVLQ
jgi:DNA-binding response OmpR family regulator